MIIIGICDDLEFYVDSISDEVSNSIADDVEYETVTFTNPLELKEYLSYNYIDILFLDIDMPQLTGFEIANFALEQKSVSKVIFVSNLENMVYEAFKYQPFRFVKKNTLEDIGEAISSAISEIEQKPEMFCLFNGKGYVELVLENVIYFTTRHNNICAIMTTGKKTFRGTLNDIEKQLLNKNFYRTHNSFLVNFEYVNSVSYKGVEVAYKNDCELLPLSRSKKPNLVTEIVKKMR